jgi:hypothetical protein
VEVRQRMKLTGTNRSFGLIALIYQCPLAISAGRLPTERPVTRYLCFAGLVALAWGLNPIPFRTRPLNPSAPMVLSLKAWESRSLPGLPSTDLDTSHELFFSTPRGVAYRNPSCGRRWLKGQVAETGTPDVCFPIPVLRIAAGWSSPVARQAHNLKVIGSNPIPATKLSPSDQPLRPVWRAFSLSFG